jgi:hypothetical protein
MLELQRDMIALQRALVINLFFAKVWWGKDRDKMYKILNGAG